VVGRHVRSMTLLKQPGAAAGTLSEQAGLSDMNRTRYRVRRFPAHAAHNTPTQHQEEPDESLVA
jgi:hypothetical protein